MVFPNRRTKAAAVRPNLNSCDILRGDTRCLSFLFHCGLCVRPMPFAVRIAYWTGVYFPLTIDERRWTNL